MSLCEYKVVESVWQLSVASIWVSSVWWGWRLRLTLRLILRLTLSLGMVCDVLCYSDVIVNFLFISLCLIDWLVFFLNIQVVSLRRMSCV